MCGGQEHNDTVPTPASEAWSHGRVARELWALAIQVQSDGGGVEEYEKVAAPLLRLECIRCPLRVDCKVCPWRNED